MILGKRPRPPIKRTTSMTGFTLDNIDHIDLEGGSTTTTTTTTTTTNNSQHPYDLNSPFNLNIPSPNSTLDHRLLGATVFPRNHRRNSADDHMEKPHFLTICHFCNRKLITGRDIFMYKGDSAFCSFECRQQQMTQDEKKDKQLLVSKKPTVAVSPDQYSSNELKND